MKLGWKGEAIPFIQKLKNVCFTQNWYVYTLLLTVLSTGVFPCKKDPKIWIFFGVFLLVFCLYKDSWNICLFTWVKDTFKFCTHVY